MKNNLILIIVSFVMFMEAVDTTIINTAIPAISHSLSVNPLDLKIALISYLLTLAIFIPVSGWMADKFGDKNIFIIAVIIFILSSFWCGFANNLTELVIARTIQGLGGSFTMPVGRLIILRTFGRQGLISKMSVVVMVASLGMMLGPVLGGIIATHFSWRWIFWVNVPVGFIDVIFAYFLLEKNVQQTVPKLDKLGFIYFGCGLATLTFSLSMFSESNANRSFALSILVISILLLTTYYVHSRKLAHPIVKTKLFMRRTFRIAVSGNLLARLGFGGVPFLLPLLFQVGLGYSPQLSGFMLAPTALGVMLNKPFSLHLLRWLGYRKLLIANTFLVAMAFWMFMTITAETSVYQIGCMTFIFGFLISLQFTGMNSLAYAEITHEDFSAVTSIMSTLQQLSQSVGVAIAAMFVRYFASLENSVLFSMQTFHRTFMALSFVTFLSAFIFFRIKDDDGLELM